MKQPKLLNRQKVYEGPRQLIHKDQIQWDGQPAIDYYVVNHADAVAAIPITTEGEILLVGQYRHPIGRYVLDIPGGCIDKGESLQEAITRELIEETGYRPSTLEFICYFHTDPSMSPQAITIFTATNMKKISNPKPEKSSPITVHFFNKHDIYQILVERSRPDIYISSSWSVIGLLSYLNSGSGNYSKPFSITP